MSDYKTIIYQNNRLFQYLADYLNYNSKFFKQEMVDNLQELGMEIEEAFCYLLFSFFELDFDKQDDRVLFNEYIKKMVKMLEVNEYQKDLYYQNVKCFDNTKIGNCVLKYDYYDAFEGFVYDDIEKMMNGKQIPKIGFFSQKFIFPAIYENDRLWMSITPNEINTMKKSIDEASGDVLAYGLGLGYYAYMTSIKENVKSVTIVEKNEDIIKLFQENIFPFFRNKEKIKIINEDAFVFGKSKIQEYQFDYVFVDLWHDVSDGLKMYLEMKKFEKNMPNAKYSYWIEKTIKCYL